jgi:group I intron endonuclease
LRQRLYFKEVTPNQLIVPSLGGMLRLFSRTEIRNDFIRPYGFVYLITNIQNDKIYVGQTIKNPIVRFKQHVDSALDTSTKNSKLQNAIIKYGENNFEMDILQVCYSKRELDQKEIEYILKLNAITQGYNIAVTNESKILTDEMRKYYHERYLGKKNPRYGTSMYQQWLDRYGKDGADKRLLEFKQKQSAIGKGIRKPGLNFTGRKHTKKTIQFMSEQKRGKLNPMYGRNPYDIWEQKYGHERTMEMKQQLVIKRNETRKRNMENK